VASVWLPLGVNGDAGFQQQHVAEINVVVTWPALGINSHYLHRLAHRHNRTLHTCTSDRWPKWSRSLRDGGARCGTRGMTVRPGWALVGHHACPGTWLERGIHLCMARCMPGGCHLASITRRSADIGPVAVLWEASNHCTRHMVCCWCAPGLHQ
jgi:hypothetical protein